MSQYAVFILILRSAFSSASQLMVSYALRMSWRTIHNCLLSDCCASSIRFLTMEIGQCVEVPFSTEQLLPLRTSFFLHMTSILLVRILVNIFRTVSNKVMGLVLSISLFQSELFGIGTILALFQAVGVFHSIIIWLKSMVSAFITDLGLFFQHS